MQVYKFGGASVKDAAGIINLAEIIRKNKDKQLLIVVSAMGKTTNALEKLTRAYVEQNEEMHEMFDGIKQYHHDIMAKLFAPNHPVFDEVNNTFVEIEWAIEEEPHDDFDFIYDQIVSIGELVSTRIVNAYLNHCGIKSHWLDARGCIHTDNTYREGMVDWDNTCKSIQQQLPKLLEKGVVITPGFVGGTSENFTTTLGREGSDYTASIFAACLKAESVTIWKDVPGVLNADPKLFADTKKYDELSYAEAIEMTYYGASVIHPKTIKPLQNANIPLLVKPFMHPDEAGTIIRESDFITFDTPVIIVKPNQVLLSISTKDYSFISENHLSDIFRAFAQCHIKVNTMQNSARSFSVCFDYDAERFEKLLKMFEQDFRIKYNNGLTLITVRHYKQELLKGLTAGKVVLLEQLSRNTVQMVVK
ncbi:aspartate kinase [Mucilaginibacter sp. PPCGB 2223]|uniref:aspartate kinase n=1 Tax=Mucilaginibacter sp. PPCGB 2223 TaxID=1886027 RepID=UPI000825B188|nr:aspartate kinase [Mucilaginibacter sp. PPCGB 2223]OCX51495.1 aspartate kinase [Mucilaginibacter sp. PPCGB 2223]